MTKNELFIYINIQIDDIFVFFELENDNFAINIDYELSNNYYYEFKTFDYNINDVID